MPPQQPNQVGRFQVRDVVGEGAFGTVYRAYDPQLQREVALKVPRDGTLNSSSRVARFLGDARSAAQLRHPHIVPVFDAGHDGRHYYIAAAFIAGETLADACAAKRLRCQRAAQVVRDLAEALAYAHGLGIVHRDVKPANVMLDNTGQPLLIDFGLAHRVRGDRVPLVANLGGKGPAEEPAGEHRTQDGAVIGTVRYMSPEQAAGHSSAVGPASDQYSLGVVLYELLTGDTPFSGPSAVVLYNILNHEPPPPRTVRAGIPRDLEAICLKALARRPEQRYADCQQLADDLRRWLEGEHVKARPPGSGERLLRWCRREPTLALSLGLTATALVAVAVVLAISAAWARSSAKKESVALADAVLAKNNADKARSQEQAARELAEKNGLLAEKNGLDAIQKGQKLELALADVEKHRKELKGALDEAVARGQETEEARGKLRKELDRAEIDLYFHTIALAGLQLQDQQPLRADQLLERCGEGWRGNWEWVYLKRQCQDQLRRATGADRIACVALTPDGKTLAWANPDGQVLFRSLVRDRLRPKIFSCDHPARVRCLEFSPDGTTLAVGCDSGLVKVWNVRDGKEVAKWGYQKGPITSLSFSPDGKRLASASLDRTVQVVEVADQQVKRSFKGHEAGVRWVMYRPDGKWLASASLDDKVIVWEADTGTVIERFEPWTGGAFSPTGKRTALTGQSGAVNVYNAQDRKLLYTFRGHTCEVQKVVFSNTDQRAASLSEDGVVKVWELKNGQEFRPVRSTGGFGLSSDGGRLAWAGTDRTVRVWHLDSPSNFTEVFDAKGNSADLPREKATLDRFTGYVNGLAFSPDGRTLATGLAVGAQEDGGGLLAGEVKLWDLKTGELERTLTGHKEPVWQVAFSPDGLSLASASKDRTVRLWNARTGECIHVFPDHTAAVSGVAFSPDGGRADAGSRFLATAGYDRAVCLYDLQTRRLRRLAGEQQKPITGLACSPDGKQLATASQDHTVLLWDVDTGRPVHVLKGHTEAVTSVTFSPNGKLLASAGEDQKIVLWQCASGEKLCELTGHTGRVMGLAFSPDADGARLASASVDRTVKLWETAAGREREALSLPAGSSCFGVAFSPDGQRLVAATVEGVRIWTAKPFEARIDRPGRP